MELVLEGKLDFEIAAEDSIHLSNLDEDPGERSNLATQYPELVDRLRADLIKWYENIK